MGSTLPSNVPHFDTSGPSRKQRAPIGGIVVTVILALALIAIIAVAVTRLTNGGLSRPAPVAAPSAATAAPAGTPADAATQQAIQQVIQQVNQAQVQAIETNNPQVMQDTATPDFY